MSPLLAPWRHALASLDKGQKVSLVIVVEHSGSVPGVTGTHVVVSENGIVGTIGGGAAEQALVDQARAHQRKPELVRFRHTPGEGGTLCSGLQIFAIMSLSQNEENALREIVKTLENHRTGMLSVSPHGLAFSPGNTTPHRFVQNDSSWEYSGPVGLEDTLYIIGGGHVSLALSRVMSTLPFKIIVLDNRERLPTMAANHWAHETRVVDLERLAEHIDHGARSWAVIMTFGHEHDREALEALLDKELAYLGLMGSEAKVQHLLVQLRAAGASVELLHRVHAPVGLPIGSHTPEEIAISIAAEIIAAKNGIEDPCLRSSST
jgi:xanthine dehydrogenase accessory factor